MSETVSYTFMALPPGFGAAGNLIRSTDNAFIPCDLANRDYQQMLQEIADGIVTAPAGWTGPKNE